MKSLHYVGVLLFLLNGCGRSTQTSELPPNNEDQIYHLSPQGDFVQKMLPVLDSVDKSSDSLKNRPESLHPRKFLQLLHPAFSHILMSEEKIGQYSFIPFRNFPQKLRDDILSVTSPSENRTGYALLMQNTWEEIFRLQDEGFVIGVLDTKPEARIGGIYSDNTRRIGLDVLASEPTLIHEYQHALQYDAIRQTRTGRIAGLTGDCYRSLSSMFAEADATNVELPHWSGLMARIEYEPDWYRDRDRMLAEDDPISYPFAQDFATLLSYPASMAYVATLNLDDKSCPIKVREFAEKVHHRLSMKDSEIRRISYMIGSGRNSLKRSWKSYFEAGCLIDGTSIDPEISDNSCLRNLENQIYMRQVIEENRSKYESLLEEEIKSRTPDLKAIYAEAPYFYDFCREMPGFRFYADCP